jgi:gliding motility-associated-like protein
MHKQLFLTTLCVMLSVGNINAQLLNENFIFTGNLSSNGWTVVSSTAPNLAATAGSGLSYSGFINTSIGNAATIATNGEDVRKSLSTAWDSTVSTALYATFMLKMTTTPSTAGDYLCGFTSGFLGTNYDLRLFVKASGASVSFGVGRRTATTPTYSSSTYAINQTYLVTLKYTHVGGASNANDVVSLYVHPSPSIALTEPTTWTASYTLTGTGTGIDASNITGFFLRQGTAANNVAAVIDGIRVATDWTTSTGNMCLSLTTPLVGTLIQPTCSTTTGSVTLSGLPTGNWTITRNPSGITTTGSGVSTTLTGLPSGTHTFTVTNAFGCISSPTTNVVINTAPIVPNPPLINSVIQPTCRLSTGSVALSGLPNGTWRVTANSNGMTTIGSGTTAIITDLPVGIHTFTVVNADGCNSAPSAIVNLNNPVPTPPSVNSIIQPTCPIPTGSVTLSGLPSGNWLITRLPNGTTTTGSGSTTTLTGLALGTHTFTVTNALGCTSSSSAAIVVNPIPTPPSPPLFSLPTQPTCPSPTGSVVLSNLPTGNWIINPIGQTGTGSVAFVRNLPPDTYHFSVTTSAGCTSSPTTIIIDAVPSTPDPPTASDTILCQNTVAKPLEARGANLLWYTSAIGGMVSPVAPTPSTTTLGTTLYYATQTISGCESARKAIRVSVAAQPSVNLMPNSATCGQNNGSIASVVTEGQMPYQFSWSNGATVANLNNLTIQSATLFTVTVTDANTCKATRSVELSCTPPACVNTVVSQNRTVCEGKKDTLPSGRVIAISSTLTTVRDTIKVSTCDSITVINYSIRPIARQILTPSVCGTTYTLPSGRVVQSSGIYLDTIRGAALGGCDSFYTTHLTLNPLPIIGNLGMDYFCKDSSTLLRATGGRLYVWSNGSRTDTLRVRSAGSFTVTVTDVNGCFSTKTIVVSEKPTPVFTLNAPIQTCPNLNINLSVVPANFTNYQWAHTPVNAASVTATPSVQTTYRVIVSDILGCKNTQSATVNMGVPLTSSHSATICSGGFYVFANTTDTVRTVGNHNHTYRAVSGCDSIVTVVIRVETPPSVNITPNGYSDICTGDTLFLRANTVENNVKYQWSRNGQAAIVDTLPTLRVTQAGQYILKAYRTLGCEKLDSVRIGVNALPVISPNTLLKPVTCAGYNDGRITPTVQNGTPPYRFSWSSVAGFSSSLSHLSDLPKGIYTLTVTDSKGCKVISTSFPITEPAVLVIGSSIVQNTTCEQNNGSINISTVTGGNGGNVFSWNTTPVTTTQNLNNVAAGTYRLIVNDSLGCFSSAIYTLTNTGLVKNTPLSKNVCFGDTFRGRTIVRDSIWQERFRTFQDCDSFINVTATVRLINVQTLNPSICEGATYQLPNGDIVSQAGTYTYRPPNSCDSFVTHLTVKPTITSRYDTTVCIGTKLRFANRDLDTAKLYTFILQAANGCDSTLIVHLRHYPPLPHRLETKFLCAGDSVRIANGSWVKKIGSYTSLLKRGKGCDQEITTEVIKGDKNECPNDSSNATVRLTLKGEGNVGTLKKMVTPDGDGVNDKLAFEFDPTQKLSLEIYNRWQKLLFSTQSYKNDWEGQGNNGEPLPDGDYYFVLKQANGNKIWKGYVYLQR